MTEKIDIHHRDRQYDATLRALEKDPRIKAPNKATILRFLDDAAIGKTIRNKRKKKIKKSTRLKYLFALRLFGAQMTSNFEEVEQDEMDSFIRALENDDIKKIEYNKEEARWSQGKRPYGTRTKVDIKVIIRKFYKWLLGDNEEYPKLVRYIDTDFEEKEIDALCYEQVKRLIEHAPTLRQKAMLHFLFDSGARIEETLNIRHKHLVFDQEEQCFKVRIEFSKTLPRTIYLPLCSKDLNIYLESIEHQDDEKHLFPFTYNYTRKYLGNLGMKYLKRWVNPHLMRHSSATYYAKTLNEFQMDKRYGWYMGSKMPKRYIDRNGISDKPTAQAVRQIANTELQNQNETLQNEIRILRQQMQDMVEQMAKDVLEKAKRELGKGLTV